MPSRTEMVVLVLLSTAIVLATIASALALARLLERRRREQARRDADALARCFAGVMDGSASSTELRGLLAAADETTFWSALEMAAVPWSRAQRRRLSQLLQRHSRVRAERRALRDDSPWRRELGARRLGWLSESRTRRALRQALAEGPELVTHAAAMGLARDRDAKALDWILAHPQALARRGTRARTWLLLAFGPGALPILAQALERESLDPALARSVLEVLGIGRWRAAAGAIERSLRHSNAEVRVAAARALGTAGDGSCAKALLQALGDEAWPVRAQAARALGRLEVAAAVAPLGACLTDRSYWVRRHAAYALFRLGPEGLAVLRREAASSGDRYARDIANEALEHGDRLSA